MPCPACGCPADAPSHGLVARLIVDDVDGALDDGLLGTTGCGSCAPECTARLLAERDRRRVALDARERFRARERRLQLRAARREARRAPAAALPDAAAAVLARALARAKGTP